MDEMKKARTSRDIEKLKKREREPSDELKSVGSPFMNNEKVLPNRSQVGP